MKIITEQRIRFTVIVSVWFPSFSLSHFWAFSSFIDAVQCQCVCAVSCNIEQQHQQQQQSTITTYKFDSTNLQSATCCVRIKLCVLSYKLKNHIFFLQFTVKSVAIKSFCSINFDLYKWEKRAVSDFYVNWILCAPKYLASTVYVKWRKEKIKIQFFIFFYLNFDWMKRF